jgi:hypothetical protein
MRFEPALCQAPARSQISRAALALIASSTPVFALRQLTRPAPVRPVPCLPVCVCLRVRVCARVRVFLSDFRHMGQKEGKFTIGNFFSKVLYIVILLSKHTRALTSEDVCVCARARVCVRARALQASASLTWPFAMI